MNKAEFTYAVYRPIISLNDLLIKLYFILNKTEYGQFSPLYLHWFMDYVISIFLHAHNKHI